MHPPPPMLFMHFSHSPRWPCMQVHRYDFTTDRILGILSETIHATTRLYLYTVKLHDRYHLMVSIEQAMKQKSFHARMVCVPDKGRWSGVRITCKLWLSAAKVSDYVQLIAKFQTAFSNAPSVPLPSTSILSAVYLWVTVSQSDTSALKLDVNLRTGLVHCE